MAFGSIAAGGRGGGFGASFPSRGGQMPGSQVVDYLRPQAEWESDWTSRRAAEEARASKPALRQSSAVDPISIYNDPNGWNMTANGGTSTGRPTAPTPDNLGTFSDPFASDPFSNPGPRPTAPTPDNIGSFSTEVVPGYTPDFSGLDAEREQMMGRYNQQAINQQSYDAMSGNGQINGVLGPNYADPNFGQVTGAQMNGGQPEGDMAWADGLYNPSGSYSTAPLNPKGWSFW